MRSITYSKKAKDALLRMPATDARRIRGKIEQYAADPSSQANNSRRLQGLDYFRLRVGDWRVIFREDGVVIDVVRIAPRGAAYEGLER
ncbi:type II toxin-antitoxin system RelE family toxin [Pararhizobium sp.]|uniref:type II toxin-antitoxin system RelE family toxin n=1 Tax=Pararhizobium sp. TaxID=1977563 RepID=UPI0027184264|nr:type II toxin-antitoxin system RelE/ParE family toxin [Pararhizobium sp.]MDO9414858.1 type II toxin-antitoxin system RelE/ParE family toxin [Pararhizobium sp.]